MTIIKRGASFDLKIEFSAPKLLFDNNLDEMEESDFNEVVNKLKARIEDMGVKVYTSFIENAKVSAFHPSKNIPLSKGNTSTLAIKELSKINLNGRYDLEKVSFRNNGHSLQFYANSNAFAMYDKIIDMSKPKNRAIDKEQPLKQQSLFDLIKKEYKYLEVLRFEIRLAKKRKMNSILKEVNYPINPLFRDIFKKELCRKILNLYWNKYFDNNLFLFDIGNNPQKILQKILLTYPKIKKKQAIYLTGLNLLCKDEEGIRGLRTILPKAIWPRMSQDLKKFRKPEFNQRSYGFIADIQRGLKEFTSYKHNKTSKV
ncbi:MAG: hypothetical protein WC788_04500 [Candidatus Paceibacterota bacterium]